MLEHEEGQNYARASKTHQLSDESAVRFESSRKPAPERVVDYSTQQIQQKRQKETRNELQIEALAAIVALLSPKTCTGSGHATSKHPDANSTDKASVVDRQSSHR